MSGLGANIVPVAGTNFPHAGMLVLGNYLVRKRSVISLGSHVLKQKNTLWKQKSHPNRISQVKKLLTKWDEIYQSEASDTSGAQIIYIFKFQKWLNTNAGVR